MLAWLVKKGWLEVRVGVMRQGSGIVHAKFGIATDSAGDAVVFMGTGNEAASGLLANYERLEVSTSWKIPNATMSTGVSSRASGKTKSFGSHASPAGSPSLEAHKTCTV